MAHQVPKVGPEPLLLSRKEIDVLYDVLDVVRKALALIGVEYIVTGGSLLGAIRQHSILFCDDDIDIAILDEDNSVYESVVVPKLQSALDEVTASCEDRYVYQIKPWEGGDRIRSKRYSNVFLDLFVLRKYSSLDAILPVIGIKRNGQDQPDSYVESILNTIRGCLDGRDENSVREDKDYDSLFPFWQFSTRKAIEMWPKEVYRASISNGSVDELFPLERNLKFGPLVDICGPNMPVTLLKRAFGEDCFDVYYRSISHQQQQKPPTSQPQSSSEINCSSPAQSKTNVEKDSSKSLPPLVALGGTWESSPKVPLEDEHYLPMQPLARKKRRPTLHGKEQLFAYLQRQSKREEYESHQLDIQRTSPESRPRSGQTVYMDGVFDLFHKGHLEAIQQCADLGDRVILGVTGDVDATGYKRKPIVPQEERVAIVSSLEMVDKVICPCPLIVTEDFMKAHSIDLVVHGFANDEDAEKQREFFQVPISMGKFRRIGYYKGLSTTDRIKIIQERNKLDEQQGVFGGDQKPNESNETLEGECNDTIDSAPDIDSTAKPQWFGAALARATQNAPYIPTNPFPLSLRIVIEPHIEKARKRRAEALNAIRIATGELLYDSIMNDFFRQQELLCTLPKQKPTEEYSSCTKALVRALLVSADLPADTNLSKLHEMPLVNGRTAKDRLLFSLTRNPGPFQEAYDAYVRQVCIPRMMSTSRDGEGDARVEMIYYQAFPCLRIVQPNEFSIGPHSDVAYGHHPCSINGYVSITDISQEPLSTFLSSSMESSSSLFLESRLGAEDWHALFSGSSAIPSLEMFPGAINLHWTTENKTDRTRVSLDFRLIEGRFFEKLNCGGSEKGGQTDVYRKTPGYYHRAVKEKDQTSEGASQVRWLRDENYPEHPACRGLLPPDFRVGFPWTVKNWEKFWRKYQKN